MKKLSEYKNEDALDLLADLIEPAAEIFADAKFQKMFSKGKTTKIALIQYMLKNHPKAVLNIMARLDGVPIKDYEVGLFDLPMKLMELLDDEELVHFFVSQGLGMGNVSFGPATETSEETEHK